MNGRHHGMRDDNVPYALRPRITNQKQIFFGCVVTGCQNEMILGDHRNHAFGFGQQLPVLRNGNKGPVLFVETDLRLRIEGRHPDETAPAAGNFRHVLDGFGIHSTDAPIQIDSAKYFDARYFLAH